jgi:AcrR family transcriptional regulator
VTRDEKILAAAEKLFFERSFDGVGVDEIGKASGTTGSAIYRHFSSKDAILAALFDKTLDALLVRLGEPEEDPAGDLEKLIRAFVSMSKSHERLVAIWLREQRSLARQYRREHDRRQRRVSQRFLGAMQRCYPDRSDSDLGEPAHRNTVRLGPPVQLGDVGVAELAERRRRRNAEPFLPVQKLTHPAHRLQLRHISLQEDPIHRSTGERHMIPQ